MLFRRDLSGISIVRNVQQAGTTINCEAKKETIFFNTPVLPEQATEVIDFLFNLSANHGLKRWEILDSIQDFKKYNSSVDLGSKSQDLLHRAAYRLTGLGNYHYTPDSMVRGIYR